MISSIAWFGTGFAAAVSAVLYYFSIKGRQKIPAVFWVLYFVLPFAAGGFHSHVIFVAAWAMFFHLIRLFRQKGELRVVFNPNSLAILAVAVGYTLSPLWAADRGMALFGIVRSFPLLLLITLLMQYSQEECQSFLQLIPLSGALMTLLSCVLLADPGTSASLTVYSRLSGFLQYPNTFSLFLLSGLIIQNRNPIRRKSSYLIDAVLIAGIILSGSRTCFILLAVALIGMILIQRKLRLALVLGSFLLCSLVLALRVSDTSALFGANRFLKIDFRDSSFLMRFLFYKDALKIILRHPFGTGFMGYRALAGLYQTGRYSVTFAHNGLLELLLDVGWIPSLMLSYAFLQRIFSRDTHPMDRLLLLMVLGHCMLDFDLQFFLFWVILLSVSDYRSGKQVLLHNGKRWISLVYTVILLFSTWLGVSDYCCSTGNYKNALAIMPLHTNALLKQLNHTSAPEELNAIADRILTVYPTSYEAYRAKANAAFASGKILDMIEYKKQAIQCSPLEVQEYLDYFRKLHSALEAYVEAGDSVSAAYCANRLLEIPELLAAAASRIDPLDTETIENRVLTLPDSYQEFLNTLSSVFS